MTMSDIPKFSEDYPLDNLFLLLRVIRECIEDVVDVSTKAITPLRQYWVRIHAKNNRFVEIRISPEDLHGEGEALDAAIMNYLTLIKHEFQGGGRR
jgi:hypothetical protein